MNEQRSDDWPELRLLPDDAGTIQAAAVQFARSLAGCPSPWFRMAIAEQRGIVQDVIEKAGYPTTQAETAATCFSFADRVEWQRLADAMTREVIGTA